MKKLILFGFISIFLIACNDGADVRGIPDPAEVEAVVPDRPELETEVAGLKEQGFEVSIYEIEEEQYIRQKYFVGLFKSLPTQDLSETGNLEKLQKAYFDQLAKDDFVSLAGPVIDEETLQGMVVFKTSTIEQADSLARQNPMVQAGKMEVQVFPWWITRGELE